jgi:hypothetical protein
VKREVDNPDIKALSIDQGFLKLMTDKPFEPLSPQSMQRKPFKLRNLCG